VIRRGVDAGLDLGAKFTSTKRRDNVHPIPRHAPAVKRMLPPRLRDVVMF